MTQEPVFCLGLRAIGPPARRDGRRSGGRTTHGLIRCWSGRDDGRVDGPRDAAASLLAQSGDVDVVRTSSRGLFWPRPMVEGATPEERIAYDSVTVTDVCGLLGAGIEAVAAK